MTDSQSVDDSMPLVGENEAVSVDAVSAIVDSSSSSSSSGSSVVVHTTPAFDTLNPSDSHSSATSQSHAHQSSSLPAAPSQSNLIASSELTPS